MVANGDKLDTKIEVLVNDVLKNDSSIKVLDGGNYGANNGLRATKTKKQIKNEYPNPPPSLQ